MVHVSQFRPPYISTSAWLPFHILYLPSLSIRKPLPWAYPPRNKAHKANDASSWWWNDCVMTWLHQILLDSFLLWLVEIHSSATGRSVTDRAMDWQSNGWIEIPLIELQGCISTFSFRASWSAVMAIGIVLSVVNKNICSNADLRGEYHSYWGVWRRWATFQ